MTQKSLVGPVSNGGAARALAPVLSPAVCDDATRLFPFAVRHLRLRHNSSRTVHQRDPKLLFRVHPLRWIGVRRQCNDRNAIKRINASPSTRLDGRSAGHRRQHYSGHYYGYKLQNFLGRICADPTARSQELIRLPRVTYRDARGLSATCVLGLVAARRVLAARMIVPGSRRNS
jgi:hypothetical protein